MISGFFEPSQEQVLISARRQWAFIAWAITNSFRRKQLPEELSSDVLALLCSKKVSCSASDKKGDSKTPLLDRQLNLLNCRLTLPKQKAAIPTEGSMLKRVMSGPRNFHRQSKHLRNSSYNPGVTTPVKKVLPLYPIDYINIAMVDHIELNFSHGYY